MNRRLFLFGLACLLFLVSLQAAPDGTAEPFGSAIFVLDENSPGYGTGWLELDRYKKMGFRGLGCRHLG